jgi:hypothetical protein
MYTFENHIRTGMGPAQRGPSDHHHWDRAGDGSLRNRPSSGVRCILGFGLPSANAPTTDQRLARCGSTVPPHKPAPSFPRCIARCRRAGTDHLADESCSQSIKRGIRSRRPNNVPLHGHQRAPSRPLWRIAAGRTCHAVPRPCAAVPHTGGMRGRRSYQGQRCPSSPIRGDDYSFCERGDGKRSGLESMNGGASRSQG